MKKMNENNIVIHKFINIYERNFNRYPGHAFQYYGLETSSTNT